MYKESPEDYQRLQPPVPQTALSVALRTTFPQHPIPHEPTEGQLFPSGYQANEQSQITHLHHTPTHTTCHALHCTLTQFNWATRTHCTNTTYLLSLDTIQCTSTTLHMNNLLHLCTSICCSTNLLLIYNLLHLTLLLCIDHIMYRYCT